LAGADSNIAAHIFCRRLAAEIVAIDGYYRMAEDFPSSLIEKPAHLRGAEDHEDLIPILREEVLAAVTKHVPVDVDKVQVKIERGKAVSLLEIDIELPCDAAPAKPRAAARRTTRSQRVAGQQAH